jgi:hypothetical protein
MASPVTRGSPSFIALAIAGVGLAACSPAPTAPSSRSTNEAAPGAVTASAPAPSAAAGGAPARAADGITITRGTLALASRQPGRVTLRGSHGFRFEGETRSGREPVDSCGAFGLCDPGATVAFSAVWTGIDLPGTARVQGDDFAVGGLETPSMALELTGSFVAPAQVTDLATVTVPFTASGLLSGHAQRTFDLTGGGQVTFTLAWQPLVGGWAITYSAFDFGNGPME